jgi:K+-sensing histidine kinase KdpD
MLRANQFPLIHYGVAVLASLLALPLRLMLELFLQSKVPLLMSVLPVLVSVWYRSFVPEMLATILSILVASYFFIPPWSSFAATGTSDLVRCGIFLSKGILTSALSESLRRSEHRPEITALSLKRSEEQFCLALLPRLFTPAFLKVPLSRGNL